MSVQELLVAFFKGAKDEIKIDPATIGDICVGELTLRDCQNDSTAETDPTTPSHRSPPNRNGPPSQGSLRRSRFRHCRWLPRLCPSSGHQPVRAGDLPAD